MLSFFPRGVLDEILNLIESVSEEFSLLFHIPCHIPLNSYCTEEPSILMEDVYDCLPCTVELQWLEHIWNHENMFETTGVVRANKS